MDTEVSKRRHYFIKKKFQLKYTLSIVGTLLVVMLVSGLGLYLGMWGSIIENFSKFKVSQDLETVKRISDYESARYKKGDYRIEKIFREAELLSAKEQDALHQALSSVNKSLIPKVIVLSILIFIGGIFLSHRIAGPMYRIERSAEAIRNGDLRVNFKTRRGDELKETTTALENMVETLHEDIRKIKASSLFLEEKLGSLTCLPEKDAQHMRDIINDIYKALSKYKT